MSAGNVVPVPGGGSVNTVTGRPVVPGPCPHHPECALVECARWMCSNVVHLLHQRGQPRRFCSTRCRVAEHRRLRG